MAPARPSHAVLVIQAGGFEGTRYELQGNETVIGRNPNTDITLLDDGISREHAILVYDEDSGEFTIEDLQSTNGTRVNGKKVRGAALQPGDQIQIGRTVFVFRGP